MKSYSYRYYVISISRLLTAVGITLDGRAGPERVAWALEG